MIHLVSKQSKIQPQHVGLLQELETRTICLCQLSKQVTSTQLADKWEGAEIN